MRSSISLKIILLLSALLVIAVASVVGFSSQLFVHDSVEVIQQMNADTAFRLADEMRTYLQSIVEEARTVGGLLVQDGIALEQRNKLVEASLRGNEDLLAVILEEVDNNGNLKLRGSGLLPETQTVIGADAAAIVNRLRADESFSVTRLAQGEPQLTTLKLQNEIPEYGMGIPFVQSEKAGPKLVLTAVFRPSKLVKAFSDRGLGTSYLVNGEGRILAHPDMTFVTRRESEDSEIVRSFRQGKTTNAELRFTNSKTHEAMLGEFHRVGFANLAVVSEIPEEKAFEAPNRVKYRALLVAIGVWFLAFFLGYFFSKTITRPIHRLVEAARRISQGDFKISLPSRGRDEIARLSRAFNEMAKGLEERDHVKLAFNKFHNREIAEKLLSGEIHLGGEAREAIVFFSDLRDFTKLSESMRPEEVVELLNEYMTRMVSIIRKYGGVVDKYIGDAIMGLWGVPISNEIDLQNAVYACLAMRTELKALNKVRLDRGHPPLKMGMGLNCGNVIVGNIGSEERMEYTVIGDTVNLASRIETMTKKVGTDFLVSDTVVKKLAGKFIFESCGKMMVKGKANAVELSKVIGFYDENRNPVIVEGEINPVTDGEDSKISQVA